MVQCFASPVKCCQYKPRLESQIKWTSFSCLKTPQNFQVIWCHITSRIGQMIYSTVLVSFFFSLSTSVSSSGCLQIYCLIRFLQWNKGRPFFHSVIIMLRKLDFCLLVSCVAVSIPVQLPDTFTGWIKNLYKLPKLCLCNAYWDSGWLMYATHCCSKQKEQLSWLSQILSQFSLWDHLGCIDAVYLTQRRGLVDVAQPPVQET